MRRQIAPNAILQRPARDDEGTTLHIGSTPIAPGAEPYVIAELGVNHDGSLEQALALTDAAASAGVDAIKLQLFRADLLLSQGCELAAYQRAAGETSAREMLRRLELPLDACARVLERAHQRGMHAIVTVFSLDLLDQACRLPWDAFKTASPDIVHEPLLRGLMQTGRPLIVSTGAATEEELVRAAHWFAPARERACVLQCVSSYPTPIEQAALGAISCVGEVMRMPAGYSDHTTGIETGSLAVMAGACVLEKHLTLDPKAQGPDHSASLTPEQMRRYTLLAKLSPQRVLLRARSEGHTFHMMPELGPPRKVLQPAEHDVRRLSRQSLVPVRDLPKGWTLRAEDLTCKRPGTGLAPWMLGRVVGRTLTTDVRGDWPLRAEDVSGMMALVHVA
jgi:N-acetylneuraminate synthase/N,N'-diacetyllegionaminate synthase